MRHERTSDHLEHHGSICLWKYPACAAWWSQPAATGDYMHVVTCMCGVQGYIWVEASKLDNVKNALRGFRFVFHSKPTTLVKMGEMIDTITVPKPKEQLLGK